jgi:thioredoxin-dependent peroxiredoxin
MIDLPKATKGRRMSKESRKKSSKSTAGQSVKRAAKASRSGKAGARTRTRTAARVQATSKVQATTKAKAATKASSAKAGTKSSGRTVAASKPAAKRAKPPATTGGGTKSGTGPAVILQEGATAPDFTLPRDGGGAVRSADYAGRKLVLFFYPKANTPGCTREAIDFTRLREDFATSGTTVLGVSADSVKAQDGFRDKHQLTVPLLSDPQHEMLEAYGVWGEKSLYGRKFLGIIRSTILIGDDGRIAKIWRNVKVDGHAEAVLAAARAL